MEGLDAVAVRRQLATIDGLVVDPATVRDVLSRTVGNPFLVGEVGRALASHAGRPAQGIITVGPRGDHRTDAKAESGSDGLTAVLPLSPRRPAPRDSLPTITSTRRQPLAERFAGAWRASGPGIVSGSANRK